MKKLAFLVLSSVGVYLTCAFIGRGNMRRLAAARHPKPGPPGFLLSVIYALLPGPSSINQ